MLFVVGVVNQIRQSKPHGNWIDSNNGYGCSWATDILKLLWWESNKTTFFFNPKERRLETTQKDTKNVLSLWVWIHGWIILSGMQLGFHGFPFIRNRKRTQLNPNFWRTKHKKGRLDGTCLELVIYRSGIIWHWVDLGPWWFWLSYSWFGKSCPVLSI